MRATSRPTIAPTAPPTIVPVARLRPPSIARPTNAPAAAYGKTIVFAAVDTGDVAYVRALVEAGADGKKANDYEMPPLAEAARTGNLEMCQALLASGAKLGEHKAALLEAAKTPEMRELLEKAE